MSNPYDPVTREELLTRYLNRPWQPAWAELGKLFASTLVSDRVAKPYHSSTRGAMKASAKTKALMQNLRKTIAELVRRAAGMGPYSWKDVSEARADIVEYITNLEANQKTSNVEIANEALRRVGKAPELGMGFFSSYTPSWEDLTFQSKFRPRRYQKDAMHFIKHYSHGGKMRDYMQQCRNSVFGMDFGNHEARVLAYYANGKGKSFIDFESLYVAPPLKVTPFSVEGIA